MKMRNKLVSVLLSLSFFLTSVPSDTLAFVKEPVEIVQEIKKEYNSSYTQLKDYDVKTLEDGTICIAKYTGTDTNVVIPKFIDGKKVTVIGEGAFFGQTRMETVVVPETVTTIENGAFVNCMSLTSFDMPDTVTSIGQYVFGRDVALESVRLSNSLKEIPADTFYYCSALQGVIVPNGVTTIGDGAFAYCTELETVEFPETIETVGEAIFSCAIIQELNIPFSVITKNVFQNAIIYDLSFSNLTEIKDDAFDFASVYSVTLPETLSNIEPEAFKNFSIANITVDENNTKYCSLDNNLYSKDMTQFIKAKNFSLDENVHTFTMPDTVTSICDYAFYRFHINAYNEEVDYMTVILPDSLESIGPYAFSSSCITIEKIPSHLQSISAHCFEDSSMTSIELKEGLTSIGANAFAFDMNFTSVSIPSTVTSIDPTAFAGCISLKDVRLSKDNKNFIMKDGCLYDAKGETLLVYFQTEDTMDLGETFVIPEGTKAIGDKAFYFSVIGSVEIPSSVTSIGEKAFYGSLLLKSIEVPSNVLTLKEKCLGYINDQYNGSESRAENFRIITDENSAAAKYAKENNIAYFTEEVEEDDEIIEMNTGDTIQLDQTGVVPGTVFYTSSNDSIVTCDENGNVMAIAPGDTSVVRSNGANNQIFDIHVEGNPIQKESSNEMDFDPSIYTFYENREECEQYLEDFMQFNSELSFDPLDNECIICYSGNEYIPLLAARGDKLREKEVENLSEWKVYDLFNMIGDGLYKELAKFKASKNAVLYRGIKDAAELTQMTSSVEDMKKSIGQIFTPKTNASTTLNYIVAQSFKAGNDDGAILEIYAPKEILNGAYIDGLSEYKGEAEYLINEGSKFLILDAGVRENSKFGLEKYFKLLLIGNDITKVNVNLEEPVPGYLLTSHADVDAYGLTDNVVDVEWTIKNKAVDGRANFKTTYGATLHLYPVEHFSFTDKSSILINGQEAEFEILEDGSALINYSYTTGGADVLKVENTKELKGIKNGTPLETIIERLPQTTTAVVNGKLVLENIQWETSNVDYDPANKNAQTFSIKGKISLDEYPKKMLVFADGVSNEITCTVSVASNQDVSAPYSKENQGAYTNDIDVHLVDDTDETVIYYTLNENNDAKDIIENGTLYNGEAISLTGQEKENTMVTIYAVATDQDENMSDVVSLEYLIGIQDESGLYHYEASNAGMIQLISCLILILIVVVVIKKV